MPAPSVDAGMPSSSSSSRSSSSCTSTTSSDEGESRLSHVDLDRPFVLPDSLSVVALSRSMERDLFRMVGAPAPAGRADLQQSAALLSDGRLRILLANAQRKTPRHRFPDGASGTLQWEDAAAIALYTDNSVIYRIVNGYLSEPSATLRDVLPVAPIVRRIYEAVQRLGTPYSGPAYRVLKACANEGSVAVQSAHAHYRAAYAVGTPLEIQQFASFTKTTKTVDDFAKAHNTPVVVLTCSVVDGFDISRYSMFPSEGEVLCLPPARFTVCNPPLMVGQTVVVGVQTWAAALKRSGGRPSLHFESSLGSVRVVAPTDPIVGREALLDDTEARLHNVYHRCVLYGPKGVGKTHLAYQLGQRWLAKGGGAHVRWFSAGSRELLEADYHAFVQGCIGGAALLAEQKVEDLLPAMKLLVASTKNVLLIFDGVEDEATVDHLLSRLLTISGQAAPNVFVLMTSTSATLCETGVWAALEGQHRKEVPVFTDAEVTDYLGQAVPDRPQDVEALHRSPLVRAHVGNHPKRLQWVSALLRSNATMTVEAIEQHVAANVTRGAVDPVFTAVVDALISHCSAKGTKGWEVLRLAALLAEAPIPVELLWRALAITEDEADDAICCLTQLSLVALAYPVVRLDDTTTPCVVLHSLARDEAARYDAHYAVPSLDPSSQPFITLLAALNSLFSRHSNTPLCYPHAAHIMSEGASSPARTLMIAAAPLCAEAIAELLGYMGSHMHVMGRNRRALEHTTQALRHQRRICNTTLHPNIATTVDNIGVYCSALGDNKQGLRCAVEALEIRRKVLQEPHPDIASSLSNIGARCSALGDNKQALQHALEALDMRRKVLQDPHPVIATSLSNIGTYFSELGDHKQALQYALGALDMERKVLPGPHPHIAASLDNIGNRYCDIGDHTQALKYALEALEVMRNVLAEPHPGIATSLGNIANRYSEVGDQQQALQYAVDALDMRRRVLPDPHPDIATSLHNIGMYHSSLGEHKEALQFALGALEMRRKLLPDPHPAIAASLDTIGNSFSELGDHKQAVQYALEALEMRRKVLPDAHPHIASSLNNVGNRYSDLGDHKQALRYAVESLDAIRQTFVGPHPVTAAILNNVGNRFSDHGDHKQALRYAIEANEMMRKTLPETHPNIAISLSTIGNCYSDLGDHERALQHAVEALGVRRKVLPETHPDIASSLSDIGALYSARGDHEQALQYALEALSMGRKVLPETHPSIAAALNNTAFYHSALGDPVTALQCALEALEMQRKVLSNPHPDLASTLDNIGIYYSAHGDHKQALQYALEALEMRRKVLPNPHANIATSLSNIGIRFCDLGDHKQALQYALEALDMRRKVLPDSHPDIAASVNSVTKMRGLIGE